MAPILIERRQSFVERHIHEGSWTSTDLFVSGIADDPVDPGSEGRVAPERVNLTDHAQEGVLDGLFGIAPVTRDSDRQAIGSIAIRGEKSLGRRRFTLAQRFHELPVSINDRRAGPNRRAASSGAGETAL